MKLLLLSPFLLASFMGILDSARASAQEPPLQMDTEVRTMDGDHARALERWALQRLRELEADGITAASGLETGTERLWALYLLSVGDKDRVEEAENLAETLKGRAVAEGSGTSSIEALEAALQVVRAKHSRWPPNKLKHLRAGAGSLDGLVARRPDDLQIRYLRLASCFFLPFFLEREESVAEDMGILISRLPQEPDAFPPALSRGVTLFLLEFGEMTVEARDLLEAALEPGVHTGMARTHSFPGHRAEDGGTVWPEAFRPLTTMSDYVEGTSW